MIVLVPGGGGLSTDGVGTVWLNRDAGRQDAAVDGEPGHGAVWSDPHHERMPTIVGRVGEVPGLPDDEEVTVRRLLGGANVDVGVHRAGVDLGGPPHVSLLVEGDECCCVGAVDVSDVADDDDALTGGHDRRPGSALEVIDVDLLGPL